jgi:ADP-dependent phosphofructokinase/glucokinase
VEALIHGTNSAATLAESGSISGPVSSTVNPRVAAARDAFYAQGAQPYDRGAFIIQEDDVLCLVPSLSMERPKVVVGLGDAMTAACFYRELVAIRSKTW